MNVLRLYFSAQWQDGNSPCPWALCDEAGTVLQQGVSPLAAIPRTPECIGILAADRVLIFTTNKPPGNLRRWRTALPFIAEEHALTDPDDLHAVPAASSDVGSIAVSVISKSWLKQILSATADRPMRRLIAESLMPTLSDNSWTLVRDGQQGFLRTSMTTGMALDNGDEHTPPLALQLSLAAAGLRAPAQIELRLSDTNTVTPDWSLPVPLTPGDAWDWRRAPISDKIPNLLWGDFAPTLRLLDGLGKLRPALYILLAALAIEVIGTHIEWSMLAREKHALLQQQEQIFRAAFGDESTLVDAPLQMQRNLAALRHGAGVADDADFIALLDAATPLLSAGAVLRGLSYESGKLELDLKLGNAAAFHALEGQRNGFRIRASNLRDLVDGTEAKLTLSQEGLR
ncbi:MAG: type II secretion system protein GspL [Gallionella sp.]|nr:type II secretion system protein GspL [Gallionella sp.]